MEWSLTVLLLSNALRDESLSNVVGYDRNFTFLLHFYTVHY